MEQVQEQHSEAQANGVADQAAPVAEAKPVENKEVEIQVSLGTAEVDSFMGIIESVIDPLAEEVAKVKNPSGVDTFGMIVRIIRRNAYPELVQWMADASGRPVEDLNGDVMLQAKALKAVREAGLGEFVGEFSALLAPLR